MIQLGLRQHERRSRMVRSPSRKGRADRLAETTQRSSLSIREEPRKYRSRWSTARWNFSVTRLGGRKQPEEKNPLLRGKDLPRAIYNGSEPSISEP